MKYRVHELTLAEADVREIFHWLRQRSVQGADAWLDAYDEMVDGLTRFVGHGLAPESKAVDFRVQQVFFKTRRGNVMRQVRRQTVQSVAIKSQKSLERRQLLHTWMCDQQAKTVETLEWNASNSYTRVADCSPRRRHNGA